MGDEIGRLVEQLQRSFEGQAWHGPSVLETLGDVSAEEAYAHPIAGAHSIWELVLHLASDYRLVLRRMHGDGSPLTPEEGWPAVPAPPTNDAAAWTAAVSALQAGNQELRAAVRAFPAERLDAPLVPEPPYTAYTQFIGVTQHQLYHAGQIALLKRALR
ncbi:MAG TPA: DinB family protein [Vicinamibacteria bacterium]